MPDLPASVRTALWLTATWNGHAPGLTSDEVWARALPDVDAIGGDVARVGLWHDLGERAVLVCLPGSDRPRLLPRTSPEALAQVLTAGECLIAPALGELLVPLLSAYGPDTGDHLDRGHRLDWVHHDSESLRIHRVEALDPRDARRRLQESILQATARLESLGPTGWSSRGTLPAIGAATLGLPPGIPDVCRSGIATAALAIEAADRALGEPSDLLTAAAAVQRESILRELAARAEGVLEDHTNLAVAVLAGWRPAP